MRQTFSKEAVLDAGLSVIREQGYGAVTMRTVADAAGCSVQPLYSLFGNKETLMDALCDYVLQWIADYNVQHAQEGPNAFASVGRAHIRIAQREPELFTFAYLSPYTKITDMQGLASVSEQPGVLSKMEELFSIPEDAAEALYLNMVIFTHGLASFIVAGADFTDEELAVRMNAAFFAFAAQAGIKGKESDQ